MVPEVVELKVEYPLDVIQTKKFKAGSVIRKMNGN
jgi:hypothetical protein